MKRSARCSRSFKAHAWASAPSMLAKAASVRSASSNQSSSSEVLFEPRNVACLYGEISKALRKRQHDCEWFACMSACDTAAVLLLLPG